MDKKKFFFIGIIVLILIFGVVFKNIQNKNHIKLMEKKSSEELIKLTNNLEEILKENKIEILKDGDTYKVTLEEGTELDLGELETLTVEKSIEDNQEEVVYLDFQGKKRLTVEITYYTPIKLAILIDDVGMSTKTADYFHEIDRPLTFATIPFLSKSVEATEKLRECGFKVILHMPMAGSSDRLNSRTEGIIDIGMTKEEIYKRFDRAIENVGEMDGFNNHMGSRFTANAFFMKVLLQYTKEKGMFYIDSKTTPKTKGYHTAKELGIPSYYCSYFLDNSKDVEDIKKEIKTAVKMAKQRKKLLVIGHYHKNTAVALKEMTDYIEDEGVKLVYVDEVLE